MTSASSKIDPIEIEEGCKGSANAAADVVRCQHCCSLIIEWLNTDEAASFLRLSVKALRNLTSNGKVPFYKFGNRNRYRRDELQAILLQNKRGQYGD